MKKVISIIFLLLFLGNCFSFTLNDDVNLKNPILLQNFENKGYLLADSDGYLFMQVINKNISMEQINPFSANVKLLSDFYQYNNFDALGVCFIGEIENNNYLFIIAINLGKKDFLKQVIPLERENRYEFKDIKADEYNVLDILMTENNRIIKITVNPLNNSFDKTQYVSNMFFENTNILLAKDFIYGICKSENKVFALSAKEEKYNIKIIDDSYELINIADNELINEIVLFNAENLIQINFNSNLEINEKIINISFMDIGKIKDLLLYDNYVCILEENESGYSIDIIDSNIQTIQKTLLTSFDDILTVFINKDIGFLNNQIVIIKKKSAKDAELTIYGFKDIEDIQIVRNCYFNYLNENFNGKWQIVNKYNNLIMNRQDFLVDETNSCFSLFENPNNYFEKLINSNSINNNLYVLSKINLVTKIEYIGK